MKGRKAKRNASAADARNRFSDYRLKGNHRLKKKTTEDTEIYREHRKFFLGVLCFLCVFALILGALWVLGDLGVTYPPIDTDLHRLEKKKTQRTQRFTEDTEKICANPCNLWISLCVFVFLCVSALSSIGGFPLCAFALPFLCFSPGVSHEAACSRTACAQKPTCC